MTPEERVLRTMRGTLSSFGECINPEANPMLALFPVDLNEPVSITRGAESLARRLDADLYLLHVADPSPAIGVGAVPGVLDAVPYTFYDPALQENLEQIEAESFRTFVASRFEGPVFAAMRFGDPSEVILDEVSSRNADVLILGRHRRSILERLLLGSVSARVVRHCACPILLLPARNGD